MPFFAPHFSGCCFLLAAFLLPSMGSAAGLDDPFSTDSHLPLRISPTLAGRVGAAPCADTLPQTQMSVIDALDLALCNNPKTHEEWALARIQAAQLGIAQSGWLPTLDGSATLNRQRISGSNADNHAATLSLSWLLLDFGQREARIENARQLLYSASFTQSATLQNLFLETLSAYYGAKAAEAALDSTTEAVRSANESFLAAESRYSVGVATPADRLQAKTALSQATLNKIKAEGELQNSYGRLANVMGFSADTKMVLAPLDNLPDTASFSADVHTLIEEAAVYRPDLLAAKAQSEAARVGIDLAKAEGRPTISLGTSQSWQGGDNRNGQQGSLGFTLNIPIFSGFSTTYRVRHASAQHAVREAQLAALQDQIALDVWQSYQNLMTAGQSLIATRDLLESAVQSEKVALGRYKAGVGSVLDLLSAQTLLANARMQRIEAQLNWYIYRATLSKALGQLDYRLLEAKTSP